MCDETLRAKKITEARFTKKFEDNLKTFFHAYGHLKTIV